MGRGRSIRPALAPSPCGFGSNKGCGVMAQKNKNGICVCIGRRGVQKQCGVVGGRERRGQYWERRR